MRLTDEAVEEVLRSLDEATAKLNYDLRRSDARRWHREARVRALRAALEAALPLLVPEWRPIESAPDEPCGVLLYYPIEDCHPGLIPGQTYAVQVAFWNGARFCEQGTAHDVLDERADAPEERPTHWQPLPAPPEPPVVDKEK